MLVNNETPEEQTPNEEPHMLGPTTEEDPPLMDLWAISQKKQLSS